MTGEVLALTQSCEIVKNVFRQDRSERACETYPCGTLSLRATRERSGKRFSRSRLADSHHAVQGDLCPVLVVVWYHNAVDDVAFGKILHRPAKMGRIDTEHGGTLTDRG